jgi:hypothetical protein
MKVRARARQRGSATVEMLIMLPVLILFMAVSFWAMQLYETRIEAMKSVRGPVFSQAIGGCGEPEPLETEPVGEVEGVDLAVVGRKMPGAPGADVIDREIASKNSRVVRTVVANGLVGITTSTSGRATMTCNESVRDGDPKAMKKLSTSSFDPRSP